MFLQRYYLECLSHASYMVADEASGEAAVIDPQRDIDLYVQEAKEHGFQIKHVVLTHFHADFISGHIELRDRCGAKIYLGAKAEAEFEFTRLSDGDAISLGDNVRLEALETPGHTPEGVTLLAYDLTHDPDQPYAAFTGDTLFIGDVGRPDLLASIGVTADELAEMLYQSLQKLVQLPDETLVYPAHGAGSMCGKSLGPEAFSTIGEQKKYNYALQPMSKQDFIKLVEADQPEAPGYFVHDAILNRQERASLDESMTSNQTPLDLDEVLKLQREGAQVVDTREAVDFAGAHLAGSINVGIDGKYATWAGTVLSKDQPIVVIAEGDRVAESIMRLGRIGFDHVAGYLKDGLDALQGHEALLQPTRRITAPAAAEQEDAVVLDVRAAKEREAGFIAGSLHIPLNQLQRRIDEVPRDRDVIVHCAGGYRSSIAASILQQHGFRPLDMVGGYKAWVQSKLPVCENASTSHSCST